MGFRRWLFLSKIATSFAIRGYSFYNMLNTIPVIYPGTVFFVNNIVLSEVLTVTASFCVHFNHLEIIIEFITLKVNRVINSIV